MHKVQNKHYYDFQDISNHDIQKKSDPDIQDKSNDDIPDKSKSRYPYGIILFLLWVFCDKYCFFCYQTIISLYLKEQLCLGNITSASIYHAFMALTCFSPLVCGILADVWFGSFWTIVHISMIYSAGNILSLLSAFPLELIYRKVLSVVGLFLAAVGAGGIKPCTPVFGGDQFEEDQLSERRHFFYSFFGLNSAAAITSTFLTPVLRGEVQCFKEDTCYALAFGFPAVIFMASLTAFAVFKPFYKTPPAKGSAFLSVFKCIAHALVRKTKSKGETKDHWLDYACDKYDEQLIDDIKSFLRVFQMFIPLPVYWALNHQQGSTWLLQAVFMDGNVMGYTIKPDQMLLANKVLILLMMPLFEYVIYPTLSKLRLGRTPLKKMVAGGLLTAIAFVMAGFIHMQIEAESPGKLPPGIAEVSILNNSPCRLVVQGEGKHDLKPFEGLTVRVTMGEKEWEISTKHCFLTETIYHSFNFSRKPMEMLVTISSKNIYVDLRSRERVHEIKPSLEIFFSTDFLLRGNNTGYILLKGRSEIYKLNIIHYYGRTKAIGVTERGNVRPGAYTIYLPHKRTSHQIKPIGSATFSRGGIYIVGIFQNLRRNISEASLFTLVSPFSVPLLYQLPQIFVLAAGEIMFVVTGLEFSYSQAPPSLKSVVQSMWLMTSSLGNLLVITIENSFVLEKQSNQFFMYAVLLIVSMLLFAILGHFYRYVEDR